MLIGSKSRKRPFGSMFDFPGYTTPGIGDEHNRQQQEILSQPEVGATSQQPGMIPSQQSVAPQGQSPGFWGGGGKFGVRDGLAGAMAVLSDGFAQQAGQQGGAVGMLAGGRMDAMEQARKAQAAQQARIDGLADYEAKQKIEQKYRAPTSPYRWEDNAGNVWERGPDGQNTRIFTDEIPKMYIQGDQAIQVPNPYIGQSDQKRPDIGSVVADPRRTGAQQPAPQGDRVLTPLQWQGAVQSLGPEQAEAWRRRNGYQIGGR